MFFCRCRIFMHPVLFCLPFLFLVCASAAFATALDDYIAQEDPSYGWTIDSTSAFGSGGMVYNLDLTSQTWRSGADVNRSVWQHRLNIAVPQYRPSDLVLLIVEGGSNTSTPLDITEYAYISSMLGCTVALLQTVPNQPLRFYNPATTSLYEDNAIGHTYDKYLNAFVEGEPHPDPTWPLLLPMVKSAVRAMDAIQECLAQESSMNITRFIVGGASKRGWTTWLTAAVDDRVVGIIPIVIDILNMDRQMAHHKNAYATYPATSSTYYMYNGYSTAIRPYTERQVFDRLETPAGESLRDIVDPYYYRDRLTMPKLIINSTGDQFFLPDGIKFYFNQLPGKNYVYYLPNTDHSLGIDADNLDVIMGLLNFVRSFYPGGTPMPEMNWSFERDGSIRVVSEDEPYQARLWQAHVDGHRDFRLRTAGAIWQESALDGDGSGTYIAAVPEPESGWTGFFIQLDYESGMSLCSGLRVLPDVYGNGAEPPDVYGPEFALVSALPVLAGSGVEVFIAVQASETLSGIPTLEVNGNPVSLAQQENSLYTFSYTVGDSDANGDARIVCRGEDAWDNPGMAVFEGVCAIDTVPPECASVTVEPAFARPGDLVTIRFEASEPLLPTSRVTVNERIASRLVDKDMTYTYIYTVSELDTAGPASIDITLVDMAGNTADFHNEQALEITGALPLAAPLPLFLLLVLAGAVSLWRWKTVPWRKSAIGR
ncbi:MAG: hypothetical protein GXY07_05695 [Candidatus Hydrogenedentes bacterium]|jgi:PhoPQ-activated pathogenicity-related protein|nr:hypothetical protein [Candidatus Hydrogenedentota bacterium]